MVFMLVVYLKLQKILYKQLFLFYFFTIFLKKWNVITSFQLKFKIESLVVLKNIKLKLNQFTDKHEGIYYYVTDYFINY